VSIVPPRCCRQQIVWSYCAGSQTFGLVALCNSNKKVSLAHNRRTTHSAAVMHQVLYAIAFRFDSHLGYFPFLHFFKNLGLVLAIGLALGLQFRVSVRVTVRVSVMVSVRVSVRVSIRVSVRVCVRLGLWLGLRLGSGLVFYVYFVSAKPVGTAILAEK